MAAETAMEEMAAETAMEEMAMAETAVVIPHVRGRAGRTGVS